MATYKQPKPNQVKANSRPNLSDIKNLDMSVGNIDKSTGEHGPKTSGVKIRGTGAATKGTMARGPMA